eukprot:4805930-Heterocapsa_arctica.AAC.1
MSPTWSGRLSDFAGELRQWELSVRRYEEATGAPVPDSVKTSIVVMRAPRTIQSYLRVTGANLMGDYGALRQGLF